MTLATIFIGIFFKKNFGEVLDLYQLPIGRNFEYLEKNGVFKFFKSLPVHLIMKSTPQLSTKQGRQKLVNSGWARNEN